MTADLKQQSIRFFFGAQIQASVFLLSLGRIVGVQFLRDKVDGSRVAKDAQSTDNTNSLVAQVAAMPEFFSGVDIADVDFQEGNRNSGKRVAEANAGMCESAGVDDDELDFFAGLVYPVDDGSFVV